MNITIQKAGRLGNFLVQIRNALHIAVYYGYNILLPKHPFITTTYVVVNKEVTRNAKQWTDKTDFFSKKIPTIDSTLFTIHKDKVSAIMKDIFVFKNISPLGNNDLVIHIRSGDIFSESPPSLYVMPPLSYYTNIINQNTFENIYLIAEDTHNPCIHRLRTLYPKIKFKIQSLESDVKLVMAAVHVVMSYGTFIPHLLNLSENIRHIYCPSYVKYRNPACITHVTELTDYHASMLPWKNTPKQIEKMLEFPV